MNNPNSLGKQTALKPCVLWHDRLLNDVQNVIPIAHPTAQTDSIHKYLTLSQTCLCMVSRRKSGLRLRQRACPIRWVWLRILSCSRTAFGGLKAKPL